MFILLLEHAIVSVVTLILIGIYFRSGFKETMRAVIVALKQMPGIRGFLNDRLQSEANSFIQTTKLASKGNGQPVSVTIPKQGLTKDEILTELKALKAKDVDGLEGKVFAYSYVVADDHFRMQEDCFDIFTEKLGHSDAHDEVVRLFQKKYLKENALNPMVVPSLRIMETEVVAMTADMLNGDADCVGFLTSGGTESVMMAVKAYRDWARKKMPWIKEPEILCPTTQHPCMDKAAHYFGLKMVSVPVTADYKADVAAMEKAITPNTVMVACSAPQFCHGIVDPVEEVSNMAARHGLPCHVDACFGAYILPWVERLGYDIPKWDFRCPGVTSISADVHKYGFCVKGASVIVYRSEEYRKHQIFTFSSWPGGLYGSPSMAGTRPGANIAVAWCSLKFLGQNGYMDKAQDLMDITLKMMVGITSIPGMKIVGNPHMTCFAVTTDDPELDIMVIADIMERKGWTMERMSNPNSFHCSILPHHQVSYQALIDDIRDSAKEAKGQKHLSKQGTAGIYGLMANIPDTTIVDDFITEFFAAVYKVQQPESTPEPESTPQQEKTPEPESTPQQEKTQEPESTPQQEKTPEPESKPQQEKTPEPESAPQLEKTPEPESTPAPDNTSQPGSTPVPDNTSQPESTPVPDNTSQPESTPVLDNTSEPGSTPV